MPRFLTLALGAVVATLFAGSTRARAQDQVLQVTVTVDSMLCLKPTENVPPFNDRDEIYFLVKCSGPGKAESARRLPSNDDYYEFTKGTRHASTGWTNQDQRPQGNPILWSGNLAKGEMVQVLVAVAEQDNKDVAKVANTVSKVAKFAAPIVTGIFGAPDLGKKIAGYLETIVKFISENPDDTIGCFSVSVMNDNNQLKVAYVAGKSTTKAGEGAFQARGDGSYDLTVKTTSRLVAAGTAAPKRRIYLGSETDQCGHAVLKVKGTGGMVEVRKGEQKEVRVASPRITWFCGNAEEKATLRPTTNLVIVQRAKEGREISWRCYREE